MYCGCLWQTSLKNFLNNNLVMEDNDNIAADRPDDVCAKENPARQHQRQQGKQPSEQLDLR